MGYQGIAFSMLGGLLFLYAGAECLISGGASFALRMGLPMLVIGLTIVGFGTSTPELVVSVQASLIEKGDIALGNVIGSNIANTALILGMSAFLKPISVKRQAIRYDGLVMLAATGVFLILIMNNNVMGRWKGSIFIAGLLLYTLGSLWLGKREGRTSLLQEEHSTIHLHRNLLFDLFLIVAGFILLILGGRFFLEGSINLAKLINFSDAVIGLTIVALGTSLPEFATTLVALFRKREDMALGNIIGSNIFNILGIAGTAALVKPLQVNNIHWIDYTYMGLLTAFFWMFLYTGARVTRWEGLIMLLSYFGYMGYLVFTA